MILVSACLAGCNCKYNGKNSVIPEIERLVEEGKAIIVCPEVLGGLPTPRDPCEIQEIDGRQVVVSKTGEDVTEAFVKGAQKTLELAKEINPSLVILKANSPSCGFGKIYDGTFTGTLKEGNGLTAELLQKNAYNIKFII